MFTTMDGEGIQQYLQAPDWLEQLRDEFAKPYFQQLNAFLASEAQAIVYPPAPLVFHALNSTPFHAVAVVILGQDPYTRPGQAMGLSFSVPDGVKPPPSLKNIFKELHQDLGLPIPHTGNLTPWARQGVLLLNAILTVREGQPGSHQRKGWETFTDRIIERLNHQCQGLVFMLWGNYAQDKGRFIDTSRHLVLRAAHPSPLSVRNFLGCRHFSQANAYLRRHGELEIDWRLG